MRNLLVVGLAAASLTLAVGCDDGEGSTEDPMGMGGAPAEGGAGGMPAGGAGGTPMGGAPGEGGMGGGGMGGTPMGGTPGEGGMGGEPEPMDTEPLGEVNEYGPSSRVTFLDIPADATTAEAAGCTVAGAKKGSALGGLLSLLGGEGLDSFVTPDPETGEISLILLSQLDGWATGATAGQTGKATFNLMVGNLVEGSFLIDQDSFVNGDPNNAPLISIAETDITNAEISTPTDDISLELPLIPDVPLRLDLFGASYFGSLRVSADGFDSQNGLLQGYLTKEGLTNLVNGIYAGCEGDMPPDLCGTLQQVAPTAADALNLLEMLVGYDVTFVDGAGSDCDADCNATGVCLQVEMTGTKIDGVDPNNE